MLPRPWAIGAALAAGIAVADAAWPALPTPWPYLFAAATAVARWPRSMAAWLIAVALLGGGAFGLERYGRAPCVAGADDRRPEVIEGVVVGPVEDRPERRRFVLDTVWGRVQVSVRGAPDRLPPVLPGDRVAVTGRLRSPRGYRDPGAADAIRHAAASGFQWRLSAGAEDVAVVEAGARASPWRGPARLSRWAVARIEARGGSETGRAVTRALVVGDRGGLDAAVNDAFRGAGIIHVLSVSGLHLVAAALLFAAAARWLWALSPLAARVEPKVASAIFSLAAAAAFTLAAGGQPATVRALWVVAAVLVAPLCDRRARVIDALGVAALGMLLARPSALWDIGAQLSFAASAALALAFGGPRPRAVGWRRVVRPVASLFAASAWAAAATAPITAHHFGEVAMAGLVANLVAVPAAELLILPFGLAGLALSALWDAGGGALLDLAIAGSALLTRLSAEVAAIAGPASVAPPDALELVLCGAGLAAALAARRDRGRRRRCIAACVAALVVLAGVRTWRAEIAPARRTELAVTFLDVGQGDAAVLELPGGAVWLVDAGGLPFVSGDGADARRLGAMPGERAVAPFLAHRRIDHVDLVVLSHPHPDHYLGLWALLDAVSIGEIWLARPPADRPLPGELEALLAAWRARGTRVLHPPLGVARSDAGVTLTVLSPSYRGPAAAVDPILSDNDGSLVVRVDYAGRRLLFAGDLEAEGEELVAAAGRVDADVVKVAHHGSPTSSTAAFVAATSPRAAIVSCGVANRFGFPDPAVLARWRAAGARIWRTDRRGAVTATVSASGELSLRSFDPP